MWRILLITLILPINIHALDFNESSSNFLNIADYIVSVEADSIEVDTNIREIIKDGVDQAVIEIRTLEEIDAYILQRSVDEVRKNALSVLNDNLRKRVPTSLDLVSEIKNIFDEAIAEMDLSLEAISDVDVDLTETGEEVGSELESFESELSQYFVNLQGVDLIYEDSDADGLSDFEEMYIYATNASSTATSSASEYDSILNGKNPINDEYITYENPKEVSSNLVSDIYEVDKIGLVNNDGELVSSSTENSEGYLSLEGQGFPNTFVTLNIFSNHIVVHTRVDDTGKWSYTFNDSIEEGDHTIYLSNHNLEGEALAVSEPISFFVADSVAKFGNLVIEDDEDETKKNITLVFLGIVLVVVFLLVPILRKK